MSRLRATTASLTVPPAVFRIGLLVLLSALFVLPAQAQEFTYNPPGVLTTGSGTGRVDSNIYVPGMRFPIEMAPAYPNSQVWGVGGSQGPSGGQCDARNYSYPWWDNYCESRSWDMPLCPSGTGHQGQDIRAATCADSTHWVVAAEDGQITSIGTYVVWQMSDSGTQHRYMHMDMGQLAVNRGDRVTKGQRLGLVSNDFGGTATTIHMHYDINQNVAGVGDVYVPTYLSLVDSYERLLGMPGQTCEAIPADGGIIDNDSRCMQLYGPPATWRLVDDAGYGGSLFWTYAWVTDQPGNWARWQLEFEVAGEYIVEIYTVPQYAESQEAPYAVRANGQEESFAVDLSGRAEGWHEIGRWNFAAGDDQWLAVYDNTTEASSLQREIPADAIRISPADGVPPMDPMPDMGSDMGADIGADMSADVQPDTTTTPDVSADLGNDLAMENVNVQSNTSSSCGCSVRAEESRRGARGWMLVFGIGLLLVVRRRT